MSIFGKIAGFFSNIANSVEQGVSDAWHALQTVWAFLVSIGSVLDEAWQWMVNGAVWFTQNVEGWAAEVFNAIRHTLLTVIPNAVSWALSHAIKWAEGAIGTVYKWAKNAFNNVRKWAEGELAKLERLAKGLVANVVKFVTGPINWVLHTGERVAKLVLNPEALAEWVFGHIAVPLIKFAIKTSAFVLTLFFRGFTTFAPEIVSALEGALAKII